MLTVRRPLPMNCKFLQWKKVCLNYASIGFATNLNNLMVLPLLLNKWQMVSFFWKWIQIHPNRSSVRNMQTYWLFQVFEKTPYAVFFSLEGRRPFILSSVHISTIHFSYSKGMSQQQPEHKLANFLRVITPNGRTKERERRERGRKALFWNRRCLYVRWALICLFVAVSCAVMCPAIQANWQAKAANDNALRHFSDPI